MAHKGEKRQAGQHALAKGRKRALLWRLVGAGAGAIGLEGGAKQAKRQERRAQRTWIAGGEAEVEVGRELFRLAEHGYYVFHDVGLPRVGNVDHVALGPQGIFAVETKSHRGTVTSGDGVLLLNGRVPERDAIKQSWRGSYRIQEIVGHKVTPLLVFTNAFVQRRLLVRGVRVLPSRWLVAEVLKGAVALEPAALKRAVAALGAETGCYPSFGPRRGASGRPERPELPAGGRGRADGAERPWVHLRMFDSGA